MKQARRLLALAAIYDGGSRSETALIVDIGLQIIRDWCCGSMQKDRTDGPIAKHLDQSRG